jgi:hypothetical protein
MMTIRTLRRVPGVLPLTRGLADATSIVVFITLVRLVCIYNAIHAFITFAIAHVLVDAEA